MKSPEEMWEDFKVLRDKEEEEDEIWDDQLTDAFGETITTMQDAASCEAIWGHEYNKAVYSVLKAQVCMSA